MRFPSIAEGVDITTLSISPFEGFLLSRMDGKTTVQDIADTTGASVEQVEELLHKLEAAGMLKWEEPEPPKRSVHSHPPAASSPPSKPAPKPSKPAPKPSNPAPKSSSSSSAPAESPASRPSVPPGKGVKTRPLPPGRPRVLYDPAELEEEVDLDIERKREILDTFYSLKDLNHYELLGVGRDAEKKDIRNAYFLLSKRFHPDTLYGKELGSYKSKMELVFKRLTDAYEVLGKKKKRAEYDSYIDSVERTRRLMEGLDEGERVAKEIEQALPEQEEIDPDDPTEAITEPPAAGAPSISSAPPRTSSAPPRKSVQERREMARQLLEKRLKGQRRTSQLRRPTKPPGDAGSERPLQRKERSEVLKGLASTLKQVATVTGGRDRAERHVRTAKEAEEAKDWVGAANAIRLAIAVAPDRADLKAEYDRIRNRLAVELADTFEKQAIYEEGQGFWEAAARSWIRVSDGRPEDAKPLRRAAAAFVEAEGDLKLARDLAQKAVALQPSFARNRAILGQVFLKAGMTASARKELEEASTLDPNSDFVKNLLRELK